MGGVVDTYPSVLLVYWFVQFDVFTGCELVDGALLITVQYYLSVLTLERQANALGDPESKYRSYEQRNTKNPSN